jgi:hypothetical protein
MMYECLCYASTFKIQYILVMNSFPILGLEFFLQKVPSATKNKDFSFRKPSIDSTKAEGSSKERKIVAYFKMVFSSEEDVRSLRVSFTER